jgi:hypothetical protein
MSALKNIGIVFANLENASWPTEIQSVLAVAIDKVPAGRSAVVLWKSNNVWSEELPIESIVSDFILGPANSRTNVEWEFFGNGITRSYRSGSKTPESYLNWLVFRRLGPKAYARRTEAPKHAIENSTLKTLDKVFTRDVANNVWHLPSSKSFKKTLDRLQSLLSWSDETALLVDKAGRKKRMWVKGTYSEDLIGKANKVAYEPFAK